jgi:Spy/CpxP family protein refolding chaperone
MKKLVLAALLVVGLTAFAQEKQGKRAGKESLTPDEKVNIQVKRITKDLNLSEKQATEVRALVTKQVQKREEMKAELKTIKEKQRTELKAKMEKEQVAVSAEYKKILTPEQYAQWEKNRAEKKDKMKERVIERREKKVIK